MPSKKKRKKKEIVVLAGSIGYNIGEHRLKKIITAKSCKQVLPYEMFGTSKFSFHNFVVCGYI